METKHPKLLEQVRETLRVMHYSYRTEQTYIEWIKRFIYFHHKRHPREMGCDEILDYIRYLANERQVSASTQNQALSAITFLYRHVLLMEITLPDDTIRPTRPRRLPTVLSHQDAMAVIDLMSGTTKLITKLLYGSGLRISECLCLRIKDLDFTNHQIIIRGGKAKRTGPLFCQIP